MNNCQVRSIPNIDNPLYRYFLANRGRCIHKWLHYFDIYNNHFDRFRNTPVTVVEIGVDKGGSLQMWRDYFGPWSRIFGVDINPKVKFEEQQIKILIGDQSDKEFLRYIAQGIKTIDIVIDDGSHMQDHMITSFEELYPLINDHGIYLVEDLHCSYWDSHNGGHNKPNTFIEYSKKMIDQLNAWHSRESSLSADHITKSTTGIHFYDSIVVFERYPNNIKPGDMTKP